MKKSFSIKDWVALLTCVLMLAYVVLQFVPVYTYMSIAEHKKIPKVAAVVDEEGNEISPEIPAIPKWNENIVASTSIFSYLALPNDYDKLTEILEEKYEAEQLEYDINGVVGICLILQFLAIIGFLLNILAQKSIFTPLVGIAWGVLGISGYVTNLFLKLSGDLRTVGEMFTHTNPVTGVTTTIVVGDLVEGAIYEGEAVATTFPSNSNAVYTVCIVLFVVVGLLSCYRLVKWATNRNEERIAFNREMEEKQAAMNAQRQTV